MKPLKVNSKHLTISPMTDEEMEVLVAAETDPEMIKAYGEMLAGAKADPENRNFYTAWKICLKKEPSVMIGDLCFKGTQKLGKIEIGYGLKEEYRGQGFATEAVRVMVEWAFSQKDVYTVEAETDPDNKASQRVLEKNKFTQCGMGEEGPRFEVKKSPSAWMAIFMCFGLSIGMSIGVSMGHIGYGMPIGVGIGIAIGAALDASEKKHRAAVESGTTEEEK